MLVEAAIAGLVAVAGYKAMKPGTGVMTPKMRKVFQHALNKIDPPLTSVQLCELADILDEKKLPAHSEILRKRAAMRDQPAELKAAHRAAYRKGMASQDPVSIRILANAFEAQGKVKTASNLRNQADLLDAAMAMSPVEAAPSVPEIDPDPPVVEDLIVSPDPEPPVLEDGAIVPTEEQLEEMPDPVNPDGGSEFGGPSAVIIASNPQAPVMNPGVTGGTPIAPQDGSSTLSPAAQLGMTDAEYVAFMNGQAAPQ
jgi:hypothetical protein